MAAARTRIKVNKDALIERIRSRKAEAEAEYKSALAAFEADEKTFAQRTARALTDLAKAVKTGEVDPRQVVSHRWFSDDVLKMPSAPSKPSKPRDYDHVIGQLEIAADDTITITGDDYAQYLQ